jgi:hypothetical protein
MKTAEKDNFCGEVPNIRDTKASLAWAEETCRKNQLGDSRCLKYMHKFVSFCTEQREKRKLTGAEHFKSGFQKGLQKGREKTSSNSSIPFVPHSETLRQTEDNDKPAARQLPNSGGSTMAFVNEYIPKEDFEKYGIHEIDRQAPARSNNRRDWTIDRERDIYLRQVSTGSFDDEETHISWWTFYWKGTLLWFRREPLGTSVMGADGMRHASSRIYFLNVPEAPETPRQEIISIMRSQKSELPESLEAQRPEIYQDLRDAFNIYGGGGVYYANTDYVHDLEF